VVFAVVDVVVVGVVVVVVGTVVVGTVVVGTVVVGTVVVGTVVVGTVVITVSHSGPVNPSGQRHVNVGPPPKIGLSPSLMIDFKDSGCAGFTCLTTGRSSIVIISSSSLLPESLPLDSLVSESVSVLEESLSQEPPF